MSECDGQRVRPRRVDEVNDTQLAGALTLNLRRIWVGLAHDTPFMQLFNWEALVILAVYAYLEANATNLC